MSGLKEGYVNVLYGFEAIRNGFDYECKISSCQFYRNSET